MANLEHLQILEQGVAAWNQWRRAYPEIQPNLTVAGLNGATLNGADLTGANLRGAYLNRANLRGATIIGARLREAKLNDAYLDWANLSGADLSGARLNRADLTWAKLHRAQLKGAHLREAKLFKADLTEAILTWAELDEANMYQVNLQRARMNYATLYGANLGMADLTEAVLRGAILNGANLYGANLINTNITRAVLRGTVLIGTNLAGADLTGCRIYGVSAWNLNLENTKQESLIITHPYAPPITVDDIEVAQFIHLLLRNKKIRNVIDTITSKAVLILGRFTPDRKAVLDAIREKLREHDYVPVVFDFEKPASRDTHETITMLARMVRFIIADITEPRSIPQELVSIVETLPSVPVKPILKHGCEPWGMYDHIKRYPWVLKLHRYRNLDDLIPSLEAKVIRPVAARAEKLLKRKVE